MDYNLDKVNFSITTHTPMKMRDSKGNIKNTPFKTTGLTKKGRELAKTFDGFQYDKSFGESMFNPGSKKTQDAGLAFLINELEKPDLDPKEPAFARYAREHMPMKLGGGEVDYVSFLRVNYGGVETNEGFITNSTNELDTVTAGLAKQTGMVFKWAKMLVISFLDMKQANMVSRSIEMLYTKGLKKQYENALDTVAFFGRDNLPGLLNNTDVTMDNFTNGSWGSATSENIIKDIAEMQSDAYDLVASDVTYLPDTFLVPPATYSTLSSKLVSTAGNRSVLDYLNENNFNAKLGVKFDIKPLPYCATAGTANGARAVYYKKSDDVARMHITVPLTRAFTQLDASSISYKTPYYSFFSQVEFIKTECILYKEGL